jgi:hypothetical protein
MQRLRFINELAKLTPVTVAAVNDGQALVYDEIYMVSNELADELLKNEADWRLLSPPREKRTANDTEQETVPVAAEDKRHSSLSGMETEATDEQ